VIGQQAMNKLTFGFVFFLISSAGAVAYGQCPSGAIDVEAARDRVQAALHSDPYFYDQHVTVSIEKDNIVLGGFVFSDWDLRDAMRISASAACNWRVLDNLQIMTGGRR
jgi:osmotically-inducible protein OsmY